MAGTDPAPDQRIPITVITGYLGAGKTTLLNHLLSQAEQRLAVIVNEFGEVGIDGALIDSGAEELVELSSGCICCTVRGDLIRTLRTLAPRLADFDGVVIETSGLASPSPIAQTFFADQIIGGLYRLNGVVAVVDAVNARNAIASDVTAVEQIVMADLVVLNKVSQATDVDAVVARIDAINQVAQIIRADFGEVPVSRIMNLARADLKGDIRIASPDAGDHIAAGGLGSVTVSCDEPLDADKLAVWMTGYLGVHGGDVLRSKGGVQVVDDPRPLVVQSVHTMVSGDYLDQWPANLPQRTVIVFIGRNLDRQALEHGITTCIAGEISGKDADANGGHQYQKV